MSTASVASKVIQPLASAGGHSEPLAALAWSPDGRWLGTCGEDGVFNVWSGQEDGPGSRPRLSATGQLPKSSSLTSLAWSEDASMVSCGSSTGLYDIWETRRFQSLSPKDAPVAGAVRCLAWRPQLHGTPPQIAIGGHDRVVRFTEFQSWHTPRREHGYGHVSPVLSCAWSPDGAIAATGTEAGSIGVWRPFCLERGEDDPDEPADPDLSPRRASSYRVTGAIEYDGTELYPLTQVLTGGPGTSSGIHAHSGGVTSLDWSRRTGLLASGGVDGTVRLWQVEQNWAVDGLMLDEPIVRLAFCHGDEFLVVQTVDSIVFALASPLRVLFRLPHATEGTFLRSLTACAFDVDGRSRIALPSADDPRQMLVWRVDFAALAAMSRDSGRPFRSTAAAIIGEAGAGKTSLAMALAGRRSVSDEAEAPVIMLPADADDGAAEVRAIYIRDVPSDLEPAIAQRIQGLDSVTSVLVLFPEPGQRLSCRDNLERWRHAVRRRGGGRPCGAAAFTTISHADLILPAPGEDERDDVARSLGLDRLFVTNAATGDGVAALREAIAQAVDWSGAPLAPSVSDLQHCTAFIRRLRGDPRALRSANDLHREFLREHPDRPDAPLDGATFRHGILRTLHLSGDIHWYEESDEVLLEPHHHRRYAAAMVSGARLDDRQMGRLPHGQAITGVGRQMPLPPSSRLTDPREHRRLLALTIESLLSARIAQGVSTDGIQYLVFPKTLSRVRDTAPDRGEPAATCQLSGAVDEAYDTLVVRLLGLAAHYPKSDLWKHEATFTSAAGSDCTLLLHASEAGDQARLAIHFGAAAPEPERRAFLSLVESHIRADAGVQAEPFERPAAPSASGSAAAPGAPVALEVLLSWAADADAATVANVKSVERMLNTGNIRTIDSRAQAFGITARETTARLEQARVALVLLSKRPPRAHLDECLRLERGGVRLIPVVLPNAARNFTVPRELAPWKALDLRGAFLDPEPLVEGIREAFRAGPPEAHATARRHVFVSYFSDDARLVGRFVDALTDAGVKVWWDRGANNLTPGSPWDTSIDQAIDDCAAFILCLTDEPRMHSYVYKELQRATDLQRQMSPGRIFVIPVRLSNCDADQILRGSAIGSQRLQRFDYFGRQPSLAPLLDALAAAQDQADRD